ncbi:hypothetical protein [Salinibius halmophilus]|uniref:hypothetical protein n=1 Tax=Salinibius halmophilus TaxID=1853216 RepID=UPI000E6710EE|nr:hypothetical protein [Salinibius halmophilus]
MRFQNIALLLTIFLTGCGVSNLSTQKYQVDIFDTTEENMVIANTFTRLNKDYLDKLLLGLPQDQLAALEIYPTSIEEGNVFLNYRFNEWRLTWAFNSGRFDDALSNAINHINESQSAYKSDIIYVEKMLILLMNKMVEQDFNFVISNAAEVAKPYFRDLDEMLASTSTWGRARKVNTIAVEVGMDNSENLVISPTLLVAFENASPPTEVRMSFHRIDGEFKLMQFGIGGD